MNVQGFAAKSLFRNSQQGPYVVPAQSMHARVEVLRIPWEQGRALERIGHAVDYLLDTYVYQGPLSEALHGHSPEMEAIHLLVQARNRLLKSLPVVEPVHLRIWNTLRHRRPAPPVPPSV